MCPEYVEPSNKRQKKLERKTHDKFLVLHFLSTVRGSKAQEVMAGCANDWNQQKDTFPATVSKALTKVDNHENIIKDEEQKRKCKKGKDDEEEETSCAQVNSGKHPSKKSKKEVPKCGFCGRNGHADNDCWSNPANKKFDSEKTKKMMQKLFDKGGFALENGKVVTK